MSSLKFSSGNKNTPNAIIVSNTVLVMKVSFSLKAIYTTTKHYNWIPNDSFDFFDLEHELGNMG